jgi:hypothetical protein
MKIEPIADILKILKPILTAKTVLYSALVVVAAFWVSLLFPQVFTPFKLDTWRAKNDTLIGMGVIISSIILLIALLVNLDNWISPRLRRKRKKRSVHNLFRNLSSSELQYLYQFIRHKTLTIEFNETDPIVGLLQTKGIIYRSPYPLPGEPFSISPTNYQYLTDHPELFRNVVSEEKP